MAGHSGHHEHEQEELVSSTSANGTDPKRLARLLSLGVEKQTESELLQERLGNPLPLDADQADPLSTIIRRFCDALASVAGKPLGQLLVDRNTDIAVIEAVKGYAKTLADRREPKTEHAVAITVYFAAIANALLFHDKKLTAHSYGSLARSFTILIDKEWMFPQLRDLLVQAREICKNRA